MKKVIGLLVGILAGATSIIIVVVIFHLIFGPIHIN